MECSVHVYNVHFKQTISRSNTTNQIKFCLFVIFKFIVHSIITRFVCMLFVMCCAAANYTWYLSMEQWRFFFQRFSEYMNGKLNKWINVGRHQILSLSLIPSRFIFANISWELYKFTITFVPNYTTTINANICKCQIWWRIDWYNREDQKKLTQVNGQRTLFNRNPLIHLEWSQKYNAKY